MSISFSASTRVHKTPNGTGTYIVFSLRAEKVRRELMNAFSKISQLISDVTFRPIIIFGPSAQSL